MAVGFGQIRFHMMVTPLRANGTFTEKCMRHTEKRYQKA